MFARRVRKSEEDQVYARDIEMLRDCVRGRLSEKEIRSWWFGNCSRYRRERSQDGFRRRVLVGNEHSASQAFE